MPYFVIFHRVVSNSSFQLPQYCVFSALAARLGSLWLPWVLWPLIIYCDSRPNYYDAFRAALYRLSRPNIFVDIG
jgi:hypothetical protein